MKDIKIINYEHKYAAKVAEMWKNSVNGWLGESFLTTKQDVITDEENSIHLNAWLALDGDLVTGYCNLYEYQEDTGALYIGLLNVRDDYHGKKIGKALVLKAVEKTIELGWDRLDLYTWSGNTKAVPLYKKTGFFWEDRDECTHLMNLIPSVLNNELVQDYFKEIDWYKDSIRSVEIKPDGRKENKFEYLTYEWEKGKRYLLMEYCRRGRGLRKIDTNEYSITATAENLKLVFGSKYRIYYDIQNKTDKPLNIQIKGKNDRNIKFNFNKEILVVDRISIEAEFYVGEIEKEQSIWKTHPNVTSEIVLNGKRTLFKVGIEPEFPAKVSINKRTGISYPDIESEMFLDIVNNFNENVTFTFELPEIEDLKILSRKYTVSMKAKEKRSIPMSYILKKGCIYSSEIYITAIRENYVPLTFKRRINAVFHTHIGIFYGETQTHYIVGNGCFQLRLQYEDFLNNTELRNISVKDCRIFFHKPKLGKPFSDEFNKKPCDKVNYSIEGTAVIFTAFFSSQKFKDIKFKIHYKLYPNGILKRWFEFRNTGSLQTKKEIFLKDGFGLGLFRMVLPYNGKILEVRDEVRGGISNWNSSKLSENWLFRRGRESTIGISWTKENPIRFGDWEKFFEYKIENLKPGEIIATKPVIYAMNTFKDWDQFRKFAIRKFESKQNLVESLELKINEDNPFVKEEFPVSVIEHKKKNMNGKVTVSSQNKIFNPIKGNYTEKDNDKEINGIATIKKPCELDIVKMDVKYDVMEFYRKKIIFPVQKTNVKKNVKKIKGLQVFEVKNSIISIKAASSFAPVLYSLKYKDKEWLTSSFPKACSKSWWSPWAGGLCTIPGDLRMKTILEEKNSVEFVEKHDNLGNVWSGIKINTSIRENEKFKGLKLSQYFLLLPGVPVMFHTLEIFQNTGRFFRDVEFETPCFTSPDDKLEDCYFKMINKEGQWAKVNAGNKVYGGEAKSPLIFSGQNRTESLLISLTSKDTSAYFLTDKEIITAWLGDRITCKNKERIFTPSRFFIFSDIELDDEWLKDLKNVRFK